MIPIETDLAHLALALIAAGWAGVCAGIALAALLFTAPARAQERAKKPLKHGADLP